MYSVGDYVKILHSDYDEFKVGDIGKVITICNRNIVDLYHHDFSRGLAFYHSEIELFKPVDTTPVKDKLNALITLNLVDDKVKVILDECIELLEGKND